MSSLSAKLMRFPWPKVNATKIQKIHYKMIQQVYKLTSFFYFLHALTFSHRAEVLIMQMEMHSREVHLEEDDGCGGFSSNAALK